MEYIGFTYVSNFVSKRVEEVLFEAYNDANRLLEEWELPLRLVYLDKLILEPGYLITLETPEGKVRLFPLDVLVDFMDYRLKVEIEKNDGLNMNKILGITSFPLASRDKYFGFYEKFLGFQTERLGRRIMLLSMRPFESDSMRMTLKILDNPLADDDLKSLAVRVLSKELPAFKRRLIKGMLHEIGHSFGLEHCSNDCVMNPPKTLGEWDSRFLGYCNSCYLKLEESLRNPVSGKD
ncbi:archaemetzincin [Thermococcus peptonophilus]|uniref:Peptidase M54 n=1 Tax=Thermococcus peptonophilus TaxID=53952 RepID=A0A142CT84_9EURY|nr:archaemetzincin [Thermococcus peptonophilus]AMQ17986.1 peptidase M54 [Thermococcus peptonophilus]